MAMTNVGKMLKDGIEYKAVSEETIRSKLQWHEDKAKLTGILEWVKSHPHFKWCSMCKEIGFPHTKFHTLKNSRNPKGVPKDVLDKMVGILKEYGFDYEK